MNKDDSQRIKFIRCVAIILIIITHILQEYSIKGFEWTHSGVQTFLILSGILVGQKELPCWREWFCKRALRIIPSYYILLVFTALLYAIILDINILGLEYYIHFTGIHFFVFGHYPFWGGHLWFISAILCCYTSFPMIVFFHGYLSNKILFWSFFCVLMPVFLFVLFYESAMPYRLAADIYSFVLGYILSTVIVRKFRSILCFSILFLVLSSVVEYYFVNGLVGNSYFWEEFFALLWPWKKIFIAFAVISLCFFRIFGLLVELPIVNIVDSISYEIYLTHKNFILGKLSVLSMTPYIYGNITIALLLTFLAAVCVNWLSGKIVTYFPQTRLTYS